MPAGQIIDTAQYTIQSGLHLIIETAMIKIIVGVKLYCNRHQCGGRMDASIFPQIDILI